MSRLRRVLSVFAPRWRDPVPCEGCGRDFTCGASMGGCWCMKVELSADARAALRQRYSRCVCRACLEDAQRVSAAATRD